MYMDECFTADFYLRLIILTIVLVIKAHASSHVPEGISAIKHILFNMFKNNTFLKDLQMPPL